MERIAHGVYTPEFRVEAVKLIEQEGLSVDQAAKRLSVPKSSLGNWVRASRSGKLAKVGQGQRVSTETEMELTRLRKESCVRQVVQKGGSGIRLILMRCW